MGEQVFGTFAPGLDNISWVIVVGIWLYTIFCVEQTNTCIENMRTIHLPQVILPRDLYFKEGGGLATHPLSCHP